MRKQLSEEKYSFIHQKDKDFIIAFDEAMLKSSYESGGTIDNGFCWGRYMIIYSKAGVKSKKVAARIYIRDNEIVLRLFMNEIDKHRGYIENAPEFIRLPFTGAHGSCNHCKNDHEGICKFRKTYILENHMIEKCNGVTFEFYKPDLNKLPEYIALFREFYPIKKGR